MRENCFVPMNCQRKFNDVKFEELAIGKFIWSSFYLTWQWIDIFILFFSLLLFHRSTMLKLFAERVFAVVRRTFQNPHVSKAGDRVDFSKFLDKISISSEMLRSCMTQHRWSMCTWYRKHNLSIWSWSLLECGLLNHTGVAQYLILYTRPFYWVRMLENTTYSRTVFKDIFSLLQRTVYCSVEYDI